MSLHCRPLHAIILIASLSMFSSSVECIDLMFTIGQVNVQLPCHRIGSVTQQSRSVLALAKHHNLSICMTPHDFVHAAALQQAICCRGQFTDTRSDHTVQYCLHAAQLLPCCDTAKGKHVMSGTPTRLRHDASGRAVHWCAPTWPGRQQSGMGVTQAVNEDGQLAWTRVIVLRSFWPQLPNHPFLRMTTAAGQVCTTGACGA